MRSLILIVALVTSSLFVYGKKVGGTIMFKGESRNVTFDIKVPLLGFEPNFERIQYKVKYYDENGKKRTLRPDDADEIWFDYDGGEVHMISCPNTLGGIFSTSNKIFLKVEIDGPLRLFRYYYKQRTSGYGTPGSAGFSGGTVYVADDFIFQKGNGPLKQPKAWGWKKDMIEYFSDCPGLRDRIEKKDLNRREVEAIVLYYNSNCGKK
jgi:hypothetical protein